MKKLLMTLPAASLLLLGAGCGGGAVDTGTNGGGASAPVEAVVAIPADFPTDVPVYKNGSVTTATVDELGASLSMESSDSPATVAAWYATELAAWKKTAGSETDKNITAIYEKDNTSISLSIYVVGSDTRIRVSKTVYNY